VAAKGAALLYDLEYLDPDRKPFLLPVTPSPRGARAAADDGREREVMISFPAAAAASTSGMQQQQGAVPPGRKTGGARTPRPKRRYLPCHQSLRHPVVLAPMRGV
jgi:WRKY transcription factor 22